MKVSLQFMRQSHTLEQNRHETVCRQMQIN